MSVHSSTCKEATLGMGNPSFGDGHTCRVTARGTAPPVPFCSYCGSWGVHAGQCPGEDLHPSSLGEPWQELSCSQSVLLIQGILIHEDKQNCNIHCGGAEEQLLCLPVPLHAQTHPPPTHQYPSALSAWQGFCPSDAFGLGKGEGLWPVAEEMLCQLSSWCSSTLG